ncbi:hypothetical protein TCAL_08978 [Tigriopus californicus]|uniref:Uncharacterized protein n=1 Tax=Tigriopus californicus TaxID=6832 RepID=A0A553PME2_TIGCA|nr:uncharacterized protein LOC131890016 [Tigriopus californicus]TRY78847.1 hypothetical protein TCAL_08978 [Tigriopus californicus]|eukprot:TCALIF_08978-PA protein Name:"Protein of unknown function" AED:0.00 eAED:0.00 QI:109/1/1/1/0.5/0.33/3/202/130
MKLLLVFTILFGLGLAAPSGNQKISESSGSLIFIPISPNQLIELFQYLNAGPYSKENTEDYSTFIDVETDEDILKQDEPVQEGPELYSNGLVPIREKRSAEPEPFFLLARLFGFRPTRRSRRFKGRRHFG